MQVKSKFCRTKIICTLGPACDNEEILRNLIKEGLDGARFNFSHGTQPEHLERIQRFRKVEKELGLKLPCILDTKGPEIRLGKFTEPVILQKGQKFTLTTKEVTGDINQATVSHKGITKDLKPGDVVLIDDGLVELNVDNITETDVVCTVKNSGKVSSNKGVNLPGVKTTLPSLTEKDIGDLKFGVENGFDFVAGSFIRTKEDCLNIKKYLKEFGGEHIQLIVKIENQEGLDNFDEILTACEGVMVARGDLGVEIPVERIPIEQKKMIRKCCKAGKIVITATQMLDSMINNPRPTRAEVTDIANAIIDGSSVVMLSGETAAGKYPVESVRYMNQIALETEKHLDLTELSRSLKEFKNVDLNNPIAYKKVIDYSACVTANLLKASAIICITEDGITPNILSCYRAKAPIFAITKNERVARQLALVWNVLPVYVECCTDNRDLVQKGVEKFKEMKFLIPGDTVVICGAGEKDDGKHASMVSVVMKVK
jgi:pyruvate kinase